MKCYTLFTLVVLLLSVSIHKAQESRELLVFAAASLTDAYEAIADAFEQANPGVNVLFNFGGSSTLAAQLVQGAPADVFASANNAQMAVAVGAGRIAGSPVTFAKNRLVVITPVDNPANLRSLHDLATPGLNLILAAPDVPVRAYTDSMLEQMAADPAYGEDYRSAVMANLVSEEPNVRQVSAKIALGEADAGIVYLSDVTPDIAPDVMMLLIPDVFNSIVTYPIAVTNDGAQPELAEQFIEFVLSETGQSILEIWGFVSVSIPELPNTVTLPTDGTLLIDGQVVNSITHTVEDVMSVYALHSVDVSAAIEGETSTTRYSGALLWDVISGAQPNLNADVPNDLVSMYVVVTGVNGYQSVISLGEIAPDYAAQPVLLAYAANGEVFEDGTLWLVVPSDMSQGRYVEDVVNISLRDAPPPAKN